MSARVSRLLGLTLRHSAPVCSCHRDSLTRWRLALAQEAARVVSSASSRFIFCCSMCLVISDNLRGRSLQAMRTYEGPASLVNLFFTHYSFLCLTHSSRPCNRDTPRGARKVLRLGALGVPSRIVVTFKPIHHLISLLLLLWWLNFLCQVGSVNGNPSGSHLENRSKKPPWRNGYIYRRRLFRRTRICEFPCARTEHRQQRLHT